jgi:hypothetical protein
MRTPVAVLLLAAACSHGDPVQCDQACRNYATLKFWKDAETEIAAAPVAKRDELRKQKAAKFAADLEAGAEMCTSRCVSANNKDQNTCLIEAKTFDQAAACVKD